LCAIYKYGRLVLLICWNVVIGVKKKDVLEWVLVETYNFQPLNWNSYRRRSKCDNSLKVYNKLDDKRLENVWRLNVKLSLLVTIHNS
jgi:hypothetical protein